MFFMTKQKLEKIREQLDKLIQDKTGTKEEIEAHSTLAKLLGDARWDKFTSESLWNHPGSYCGKYARENNEKFPGVYVVKGGDDSCPRILKAFQSFRRRFIFHQNISIICKSIIDLCAYSNSYLRILLLRNPI